MIRLLKWFWRAWPVIIILVVFNIHLTLISYFGFCETNKLIALITQLVGGCFILYSIDSNIGIIQNKNLVDIFFEYIKAFPLIKRPVVLGPFTVGANCSASIEVAVTQNPKTIEDTLKYLQKQITENKIDTERRIKSLDKTINQKIGSNQNETKSALLEIETKMEKVSIGGIKVQIFGILLMVYGAITSYIA